MWMTPTWRTSPPSYPLPASSRTIRCPPPLMPLSRWCVLGFRCGAQLAYNHGRTVGRKVHRARTTWALITSPAGANPNYLSIIQHVKPMCGSSHVDGAGLHTVYLAQTPLAISQEARQRPHCVDCAVVFSQYVTFCRQADDWYPATTRGSADACI